MQPTCRSDMAVDVSGSALNRHRSFIMSHHTQMLSNPTKFATSPAFHPCFGLAMSLLQGGW